MKRNITHYLFIVILLFISCSNSYENEDTQTLTIKNNSPYVTEYSIIKENVITTSPDNYNFQEQDYIRDINETILKHKVIPAKDKALIVFNKKDIDITILFWIEDPREKKYAGKKSIKITGDKTVTFNLGDIN